MRSAQVLRYAFSFSSVSPSLFETWAASWSPRELPTCRDGIRPRLAGQLIFCRTSAVGPSASWLPACARGQRLDFVRVGNSTPGLIYRTSSFEKDAGGSLRCTVGVRHATVCTISCMIESAIIPLLLLMSLIWDSGGGSMGNYLGRGSHWRDARIRLIGVWMTARCVSVSRPVH